MLPTFLPILTLFLFVPIYMINRKIFISLLVIELLIFIGGYYYIGLHFQTFLNKTLYYTALGGGGLAIAFIGFFIAIFSNHKSLYSEDE